MVNWNMIGALVLPNAGVWISAFNMSGEAAGPNSSAWYETLKKPRWNPPNWVFIPASTTFYTGMGYASYLVYEDCGGFTDAAVVPLALYGCQLLLNWTWSTVFFKFHKIGLAFSHMLTLDTAAAACAISFFSVNKKTAYFMTPYLCMLSFATYFNYRYWRLNCGDDKKL